MDKLNKKTVELDEKITKQKKDRVKFLTVFEYSLLVVMIGMSFWFVNWLWAVCIGFVVICLQIVKVVDWLTIREKTDCDICHKKLIGEENEKK